MKQKTSKLHWDDNICPPNPPQVNSSSNPYDQQLKILKRGIKETYQKLATILKLYSSNRKVAILEKVRVDIQNMAHIDPRKQIKLFEDFESLLSKWVDSMGRCVSDKEFKKELDVFNNEYKSLIQRKKLFEDIGGKEASTKENLQKQQGKPQEAQNEDYLEVKMKSAVSISYSHKDERWLNDLQTHLKPYVRDGSVTVWSDKQIAPGSKWFPEIKAALASTKVAVMLVTPNFLASDFIDEHELGPLLKEAEKGGVRILWIPVRACAYKKTPLKDYQAVVDPDKPLANMKAERDNAWVKICGEIEKAVNS
jgi:hypothetical protein